MFSTDQVMRPDALARAAEERGFVSLYVPEHTHIPVSRRTPPPSGDAVLPDYYKRAFDPFVAMAMAAAATERLRVGTGICLVAQRDPIVTAKAVASLDHLSGGRFVFGVGFGWNADGWIPIGGAGVREALPQLHRAVEAAGRDPSTVRIVPFGTIPDPGKLDYYASIGIDEVVLRVPAGDRDAVVPVLDDYSKLVET